MQQGARDELKMFSQARGAYLSGLPGYAYDSRAGQGITVYVVDTGINPNHPEFTNMPGSLRWLYIPGEPQVQSDENGHGTCVVSKVMGPTFGVAKGANIVVVKVPPINDIASNNLQGRAVFTTTVDVYANTLSEDEKVTYTACVRDLIDLDVVVVVASGNVAPDRPELALSTYPGLLAAQYPIVVVGGVQPSGIYAPYSQGFASELTVSADGYVRCADYRGGSSWWQGTSFSTPAVAGLAAYFMSLDQYRGQLQVQGSVARHVRDLIKSLAYARRPLQPAVVWNGIDSRQIACPVRRDTRSSGCPARNTTLPIVPPATPPPNTAKARSTTIATSSSKPPTSSITTDSSTTTGGEISSSITLTIPLGGFVTISESSMTGDLPVPTNAPGAINLPT